MIGFGGANSFNGLICPGSAKSAADAKGKMNSTALATIVFFILASKIEFDNNYYLYKIANNRGKW